MEYTKENKHTQVTKTHNTENKLAVPRGEVVGGWVKGKKI